MDYNAYEILGLSHLASREQIDQRYQELRAKYQKDRFLEGDAGEEAAENLQKIEVAYRDILFSLEEKQQQEQSQQPTDYATVEQLIKDNNLDKAQEMLDNVIIRDAEWHYLQSVLFYKRNWFLESKKQLEMATKLDPSNERYQRSLEKLTKILASNTINPDQMRTTSRPVDDGPRVGAGNGTCTGSACGDCLLCNACCNCMQCMGGC
ncbi:MAG: J domain-containing protein [Clostridia bacterium]|nr:J domain-containing protein [Clostridia bacterium]